MAWCVIGAIWLKHFQFGWMPGSCSEFSVFLAVAMQVDTIFAVAYVIVWFIQG